MSTTRQSGRTFLMARASPTTDTSGASSRRCGPSYSGTLRHKTAKSYGYRDTNRPQGTHMATNLPTSHAKQVADFLQKVRARGRLMFIIDATGSCERAWDAAAQLQGEMFAEAGKFGTLEMQVTYFGGLNNV